MAALLYAGHESAAGVSIAQCTADCLGKFHCESRELEQGRPVVGGGRWNGSKVSTPRAVAAS